MNLIKIADNLKGLTDEALVKMSQSPDSFAPAYMVTAEMSRRENLRDGYQGATSAIQDQSVQSELVGKFERPLTEQSGIRAMPNQGFAEGGIIPRYQSGREVTPFRRFLEDKLGLPPHLSGPMPRDEIIRAQNKILAPFARERNERIRALQSLGNHLSYDEDDILFPSKTKDSELPSTPSFFDNLFTPETDEEYKARLEKGKANIDLREGLIQDRIQQERDRLSGKKSPSLIAEGMLPAQDVPQTVIAGEDGKYKINPQQREDTTIVGKDSGTGTGIETIPSALNNKKNVPTGAPPANAPLSYQGLLAQELKTLQEQSDRAKNAKDTSFGKGLMTAGLGLLGGQNIGEAGISGISAFEKQKALDRANLANLAKDRRSVLGAMANIGLKEQELGLKAQDLDIKTAKNILDKKFKLSELNQKQSKAVGDLYAKIIKERPGILTDDAMAEVAYVLFNKAKKGDKLMQDIEKESPGFFDRIRNMISGDN